MEYPRFLNENESVSIAVIAPSNGISDIAKLNRLDSSIKYFKTIGCNVIEGKNIRNSIDGRSGSVKERLEELYDMYNDSNIKYISCVSGGDYLGEILNKLDFNVIKNNVKWLQGYSDPTGLLYTITTKLDIATIYGSNFCSFGMSKLHSSLKNNIEMLKGNIIPQYSFDKYENGYHNYITGIEEYVLDKEVKWINLDNKECVKLSGRIIGGCTDVLLTIVGTKLDYTKEFLNRYNHDKFIWYFDNFDITEDSIYSSLTKFNNAGWFKNISGIMFGRNTMDTNGVSKKFIDEVKRFLIDNNINIDVIFDTDIGHKPPQLSIINGSMVEVVSENKKGCLKMYLK